MLSDSVVIGADHFIKEEMEIMSIMTVNVGVKTSVKGTAERRKKSITGLLEQERSELVFLQENKRVL